MLREALGDVFDSRRVLFAEDSPPTVLIKIPSGSASVEPSGDLAVFPGSILHLECLFSRKLGNPEWTWTSTFRQFLTGKLLYVSCPGRMEHMIYWLSLTIDYRILFHSTKVRTHWNENLQISSQTRTCIDFYVKSIQNVNLPYWYSFASVLWFFHHSVHYPSIYQGF